MAALAKLAPSPLAIGLSPDLPAAERCWRAMGTDCHAMVVGPDPAARHGALDLVVERVEALEARWSRFRPESDIARANATIGWPVVVARETIDAVAIALEGRTRTGGRFDPTIGGAVIAAGYDRSFDRLLPRPAAGPAAPGGALVSVDREWSTITVPAGGHLDLGGIGKGLAADLATMAALDRPGVTGACVNLGGDLRVAGASPAGEGWGVVVDDPHGPGRPLALLALAEGAVATSSTVRRRWRPAGWTTDAHHLIDGATGRPATTDLATVTTIAGTAGEAEMLATAATVAGTEAGIELVADAGAAALLVRSDGTTLTVGPMAAYLR